MKDFDQHVTMLSLNDSPNAWRTAGPITQIADTPYPFNKNRPTAKEVRYCLRENSVVYCRLEYVI